MSAPLPSSWIYFPTDTSPSTKYKFASIEINLSPDVRKWERSTYSLLDWLGDLGGLYDALKYICSFIISPLSVFAMNQTVLTKLFRFKDHEKKIKHSRDVC